MNDPNDYCVMCGKVYIPEGEGMICLKCQATGGPQVTSKNIHIENSYNVWNKRTMFTLITEECKKICGNYLADKFLNRTYKGMYIEWYLHNIGYWLTRPFIKNNKIKSINERCKHVDLEEHK